MVEIRKIYVRSSGKYQNQLVVQFSTGATEFKKRSLRGSISIVPKSDNTFNCKIEVQPNTAGRARVDGLCMVHKAYKGAEDELELSFSTTGRFGGKLADGECSFTQTNETDNSAAFTLKVKPLQAEKSSKSAPKAPTNTDELIAAIATDETLRQKLISALVGDQPAKVAPQPAPATRGGNFWGKGGLPPGLIKRIQSMCKTYPPAYVATQLGLSEVTVRKYRRQADNASA